MTRATQRLLPAGLLALLLHGAALSWQLHQGQKTLPTPLPVQRIAVSLGVKEVVREQPPEPKQVHQPQQNKEVLLPAKPPAKVDKQSPAQKSAVLPHNKPKPVGRKPVQKKQELQKTVPTHDKQSVVQPPPSLKESPEHKPTNALAAPSSQASAAAQVIRQATPLYQINPPPKYPRLARHRGLEGVVLLEALIDISGKVADLRIFTSSGHPVLDRAALKAVRRWRFTPGTIGGRGQEMWVKVPIRFQLK